MTNGINKTQSSFPTVGSSNNPADSSNFGILANAFTTAFADLAAAKPAPDRGPTAWNFPGYMVPKDLPAELEPAPAATSGSVKGVGRKLTNGEDAMWPGELRQKLAGASENGKLQSDKLQELGLPKWVADGLDGVSLDEASEEITKARGKGLFNPITSDDIDNVFSNLIANGPKGVAAMNSDGMTKDGFNNVVEQAYAGKEATPLPEETKEMFNDLAGEKGKIDQDGFKKIAGLDDNNEFSLREAFGKISELLGKIVEAMEKTGAQEPEPALPYPGIGSKWAGETGKIKLDDLAKKLGGPGDGSNHYGAAGIDGKLQSRELEALGVPKSSALALNDIPVGELVDAIRKASGGDEATGNSIDRAVKGLIDERGGPKAETEIGRRRSEQMRQGTFDGFVNEARALRGEDPLEARELRRLFDSFGGRNGSLNPEQFSDLATLENGQFSLTEFGENIQERLSELEGRGDRNLWFNEVLRPMPMPMPYPILYPMPMPMPMPMPNPNDPSVQPRPRPMPWDFFQQPFTP